MGDKIYGESQDLNIMVHIVAVQMPGFLSAWLIIEFSLQVLRYCMTDHRWNRGMKRRDTIKDGNQFCKTSPQQQQQHQQLSAER